MFQVASPLSNGHFFSPVIYRGACRTALLYQRYCRFLRTCISASANERGNVAEPEIIRETQVHYVESAAEEITLRIVNVLFHKVVGNKSAIKIFTVVTISIILVL